MASRSWSHQSKYLWTESTRARISWILRRPINRFTDTSALEAVELTHLTTSAASGSQYQENVTDPPANTLSRHSRRLYQCRCCRPRHTRSPPRPTVYRTRCRYCLPDRCMPPPTAELHRYRTLLWSDPPRR